MFVVPRTAQDDVAGSRGMARLGLVLTPLLASIVHILSGIFLHLHGHNTKY